jgi:non-specific serine/threonine protein kinase/serine/threonine-protein kinase
MPQPPFGHLPTEALPAGPGGPGGGAVPSAIGAYRLLRQLGEGGMGEVWLAEQLEPVRREVALKLIKPGLGSREVLARFESERQALARMDHPSIARVLDAGTTADGRPYFVMEFVDGEPITRYCDRHQLSVRDRLELFREVCAGVQHAHVKGIIHRDLKPTNVLVREVDGRPAPKIIDFGIARAVDSSLSGETLLTRFGELVGTPGYMSPEQAAMDTLDIDTRTDVYSLGVLLYELLAGALPHDPGELRQAGLVEMRRRILEDEPPWPSTRVGTRGDSTTATAANRHTELPSLRRQLRGDLDWITMRALEKDRGRRYSSPSELAADIDRHLRSEPVLAGPPSVAYRAGKFVRRHRAGVAVAAGLLLTLVVFAVTMAVQARRIARERDRAESEAAKARAVNEFMRETLGAASPWQKGHDVTVAQALDAAVLKVAPAFAGQPEIEGAVRHTLGDTYQLLGRYDEAEPQLEQALALRERELGPEHIDTLESRSDLAELAWRRGDFEGAERRSRELLELHRRRGDEANAEAAQTRQFLAQVLLDAGQYEAAAQEIEAAFELSVQIHGEQSLPVAMVLQTQGALLQNWKGDFAGAEEVTRREIAIRRAVQGADALDLAYPLNNLAVCVMQQGRNEEAIPIFEEAIAIQRRWMGDSHPDLALSLENLGGVYYRLGQHERTLDLLDEVIAMRRAALGDDSAAVARTLVNMGAVLRQAGEKERAEAILRDAVGRMERAYGPDHSDVASTHRSLGWVLGDLGRLAEAEKEHRAALAIAVRAFPAGSPSLGGYQQALGDLLVRQGGYEEAEPLLIAAHESHLAVYGSDNPRTAGTARSLVSLYEAWGRPAEAVRFRAP